MRSATMKSEYDWWIWCAEQCECARTKGMRVRFGPCDSFGLCELIDNYIPHAFHSTMMARIQALPDYDLVGYKWPRTLNGAKQRAVWCREQAALLKDRSSTPSR